MTNNKRTKAKRISEPPPPPPPPPLAQGAATFTFTAQGVLIIHDADLNQAVEDYMNGHSGAAGTQLEIPWTAKEDALASVILNGPGCGPSGQTGNSMCVCDSAC